MPGEQKKLYLSAILGLYGRYPVAYVASARNDNRLVFETFDRAVAAFKITDEASLGYAIKDYLRFYSEERPQGRYHCKTPLEVRLISHSLTGQASPVFRQIGKLGAGGWNLPGFVAGEQEWL